MGFSFNAIRSFCFSIQHFSLLCFRLLFSSSSWQMTEFERFRSFVFAHKHSRNVIVRISFMFPSLSNSKEFDGEVRAQIPNKVVVMESFLCGRFFGLLFRVWLRVVSRGKIEYVWSWLVLRRTYSQGETRLSLSCLRIERVRFVCVRACVASTCFSHTSCPIS